MKRLRQLATPANLLALTAGASLTLAFAPFGYWPLAILSAAVLIGLWAGASPRSAFRYGYLYGLGMFGTGTGWLHISINLFGGVNLAGAIILTLLFVLFISLYTACAGYLSARLYRRDQLLFSFLLTIPAVWTLAEWMRSWLFTGFPWLNLGYSQTDSLLAGLAPLTGVFGISFAVMLSAGCLHALWRAPAPGRIVAGLGLVALWLASAWSAGHDWTRLRPDTLTVTLVQGAVPQELKWTPEMRQPTLDRYMDLTRPHLGSDLIIWPEAAIPAFYDQIRPWLDELTRLTSVSGSRLLTGLPYRDLITGEYLNSIVLLDDQPAFYFKRHLVPFGEYLPLDFVLRDIVDYLGIPMSDFSAGKDLPPLLRLQQYAIGVSICYEDTFGNEVIEALPEAALLVNVSNDAWFGDSLAPHQHLQMARMRAMEAGRYLLRATNTGLTAIIDEKGRTLADIPQFTPMTLTGTASLFDGLTPYARSGNYAILGLLVLVFAMLAVRNKKAGNKADRA